MPRCEAQTRSGRPCRNGAEPGSDRCWVHRRADVDEAAMAQLEQLLRAGNYLEVAARAAGVPIDALPAELLEAVEVARATGEARGITLIAQAAREGNWQAAAWLLERQYPERWGRPAMRAPEDPEPVLPPAPDGVDELAGKRDARRAARR